MNCGEKPKCAFYAALKAGSKDAVVRARYEEAIRLGANEGVIFSRDPKPEIGLVPPAVSSPKVSRVQTRLGAPSKRVQAPRRGRVCQWPWGTNSPFYAVAIALK
jgi:hypothetical protein